MEEFEVKHVSLAPLLFQMPANGKRINYVQKPIWRKNGKVHVRGMPPLRHETESLDSVLRPDELRDRHALKSYSTARD